MTKYKTNNTLLLGIEIYILVVEMAVGHCPAEKGFPENLKIIKYNQLFHQI